MSSSRNAASPDTFKTKDSQPSIRIMKPTNRDWIKEILELGDNANLLPQLLQQFAQSSVIPFVGAGLSAPYNLPQWAELVKGLVPDEEIRTKVEERLAANDYEGAAEVLMEVRGPRRFQLLFRERFESIAIDLSKKTAVSLLARFRRGPIITTNFDRVIESVLEHEGCSPKVIAGEHREAISRVFQYDQDALIKVHGDINDPAGRVLSKSEYDEAYSRWLDTLLRNMATRSMVFLGCSLETDRPMKVLADLVKGGHGLIHHYAFLSFSPTPEEVRKRSKQLSEECHIDVIWYPTGKHECVTQLLEYVIEEVRPEPPRNRRGPIYRNIPEGRATLFGRNCDPLVKLIESSRLVSVEGSRGVGKTSFALQALRKLMDKNTFSAPAWITASARKDKLRLSHVLDAISLAIDYPFRAPVATTQEKESKLAEELKRRKSRCLLLFDNYETVTDPDVEGFLFDPKRLPENLYVLFTLSGRLERAGVVSFPLEELDAADTIAMFRDRLARHRLKQESDEDVGLLHKTVGGNPLAIELIVGLLRMDVDFRDLLKKLNEGKGNVLQRIFEESSNRLDSSQGDVLQAVSIFVRPALAEAVQAASNLSKNGFEEALEVLARLYLLKRLTMHEEQDSDLGGRRYFVHPYIRDLLERRDEKAEAAFYNRLAKFYAQYIPERGGSPEKEEAAEVQELDGELDNILGVFDGCWKVQAEKLGVVVVTAMARWLFTESHWDDLEKYGTGAASDAQRLGDHRAAARILSEIGRTHSYRLDFTGAAKIFDKAMKLARKGLRIFGDCLHPASYR